MQKSYTMNTEQLKKEIEKLAAKENCTFVEACQAMQAAAAKMKNEQMISVIHKIKMASLTA